MSELEKYRKWKDYLHQYSVEKFTIKPYKFYFDAMYRGRKWNGTLEKAFDEFSHVKRIHAPNKRIVNMGRCNLKGDPILYLSSSRKSIPFEINLAQNSMFCVAKFEAIRKHTEIGPYAVTGHNHLKENPVLTGILSNYTSKFSQENIIYDEKIGRIMSAKKMPKGYDIYSITNAICSMYFNTRKKNSVSGWSNDQRTIGLLYPCVHFIYNSFNLAMKQREANKVFRVSKLELYEYLGYENGMQVQHLADGRVDSNNGKVKWKESTSSKIKKFV